MTLGYFKKSVLPLCVMAAGTIFLASCTKDNKSNDSQLYSTTGNASGNQENPSNSSSGNATLTGTYNAATNVWQYNINWSSLSSAATAAELHGPASAGANGVLMLSLAITAPGISGSASGNVVLTAQQEADLLADKCYYTILSSTYLTGEIRGQITTTAN